MFKKLFDRVTRTNRERADYYDNARGDIQATNLSVVMYSSICGVIVVGALMVLASFLVDSWSPSTGYYALLVVLAVFFVVALRMHRRGTASAVAVNTLMFTFITVLFAFVIFIDAYITADAPSSFVPLLFIVVPVLFIVPMRVIFSLMGVFEVVYIACLLSFKVPPLYQSDIFNSVVGLLISILVVFITMTLRARNNVTEQRYRKLSMIDGLTGIMNKVNCENAVRNILQMSDEQQLNALIIVDIDDFKSVNDTLGHKVGDVVLEKVGAQLLSTFRDKDVVGRVGGDEFMVLMRDVPGAEVVERKCDQVGQAISRIAISGGGSITCSVGAALQTPGMNSYETLVRSADDALYEGKHLGKARCVLHVVQSPIARTQGKGLLLVADDDEVTRTMLRNQFQDTYDVVEASTGAEALSAISLYREELSVIFLNLLMPGLGGLQVLGYLQSRSMLKNIPVVVISADSSGESAILRAGASDMMTKPIDPTVARDCVERALAE